MLPGAHAGRPLFRDELSMNTALHFRPVLMQWPLLLWGLQRR